MDKNTFRNLSSGLYIIGTKDGEKNAGCVVNTVTQATSSPVTLTVCINKDNFTNVCLKKTKKFAISILSERVKENTLAVFGFCCSRERDKFSDQSFGLTPSGMPYIKEGVTGYIQCKVIDFVDNYTHTIFIAEAEEAENILNEQGSIDPPMTYAYYHTVIKGKTPKNASSYQAETGAGPENCVSAAASSAGSYKCSVCGYVYTGSNEEFEKLPDDYKCPICKVPKNKFFKV